MVHTLLRSRLLAFPNTKFDARFNCVYTVYMKLPVYYASDSFARIKSALLGVSTLGTHNINYPTQFSAFTVYSCS